ncbi:MAG: putative asparagine synthetase (glutamine-hydrolyzing) [Deltaproteobacteria bacterium ADurb.Bin151]|nr:MAG: putative asparagine synthetase (glutamine-hydrolyzing) [Deltaproteobacteria bacterium ADurb.Bin151]
MCGIAGLIDASGKYSNSSIVRRMAEVMINRGPDGYGEFIESPVAMAMRRLSVIDLEHGWQPFFSDGNRVVAFQNGEIYNFRELRTLLEQKGYHFISHSDTEVLAHGFAQWGIEGLLKRIDGMYAIAILDKKASTLYLARDRFGEKPLFYTGARGKFAYSSNLKSLVMLPWVSREIEPKAVDYYLALHYVPGEMTFFKSIRRVLPGEYLAVPLADPHPKVFRYYRPSIGITHNLNDNELTSLIEQSVESRLVADVPVGIFLSGGLDSSIVAAIAAKTHPEIMTFSMGFESMAHDESAAAELVAKSIGSTHQCFQFKEDSFINLLPQVATALDEPVGDQAMLPLYWLCQEARKHVKVVLAGEGADEVFAGYSYYDRFLQNRTWRERITCWLRRSSNHREVLDHLIHNEALITPSGFPLLTDAAMRRRLIGHDNYTEPMWEVELLRWLNKANDPLQRATAAELTTWLPDDLLVKFDRMAMAHSLEGRAPYLHPAIVKAGLFLPQQQRMNHSVSKVALRRIAAKWLPPAILDKPKQGFVLPMKKWLIQWFAIHGSVDEFLESYNIDFLDMDETVKLVRDEVEKGVTNERFLFALVLLFEWYKNHLCFFKNLQKE